MKAARRKGEAAEAVLTHSPRGTGAWVFRHAAARARRMQRRLFSRESKDASIDDFRL